MLALIILLVFGIGVSVFALQNTLTTTVSFFGFIFTGMRQLMPPASFQDPAFHLPVLHPDLHEEKT